MSQQSRPVIVTLTISVLVCTVFLIAYKVVFNYFEYEILNNTNEVLDDHHTKRATKQRRI